MSTRSKEPFAVMKCLQPSQLAYDLQQSDGFREAKRFKYAIFEVSGFNNTLSVWMLEAQTFNVGHLDPPGN